METTLTTNQQAVLDQLRSSLVHTVTAYDMKQSGKRGHNPYAIGHYLGAVNDVIEELGANPNMLTRTAIVNHFNDRLCDVILKSLGFANPTTTTLDGLGYFVARGIKLGSKVRLYFAGGPHDMPLPWIVTNLEEKYSSANGKMNPSITVKASNGVERTFDNANWYSPRLADETESMRYFDQWLESL